MVLASPAHSRVLPSSEPTFGARVGFVASAQKGKHGRPQTARSANKSQAGLTLIEIMVVVVIIALGASAASMGLGSLSRANLKSASVRLMALSRYAYHRALTRGTTVRISLDFESNTFEVSEAHGRVSLTRSDSPLRTEAARSEAGDPGAAIDPWEAARARLAEPDALPVQLSPFSPITTESGTPISRFKRQPLGDGIRIVKLVVAHEAEPRTTGTADVFFFPGGHTQHAVIQIADKNDTIFSVEIHPLTGKATIHSVPYEPEVLMDDPDERNERASELDD